MAGRSSFLESVVSMKDPFAGVFRDKRVLVTGHTGFKGSWLSIWLNELGAKVIGFALTPELKKANFVAAKLSNKIVDIRGDIRDFTKLFAVFNKFQPEFVFHLAAQPLVTRSYLEPRPTYQTNLLGTVNLLEAVRLTKSVKVIVNVTSDKCYQNREWVWGYRESDSLGGYDPYSSSKACAELITAAYRQSFFNPEQIKKHRVALASARAGNVIGGGDWASDRIIPDCIKALQQGSTIQIKNPSAVRPWQHVLEPLSGYLLLAAQLYQQPDRYSEAWNFGPEQSSIITVKGLVEKVINCWGSGHWKDLSASSKFHETKVLSLDISKATRYLGWKPRLNLDQTIKLTVDWYQQANPTYQFNVEQIEAYLAKWD